MGVRSGSSKKARNRSGEFWPDTNTLPKPTLRRTLASCQLHKTPSKKKC